jgi:predicted DNA-binding ribbon-helix-helix protein
LESTGHTGFRDYVGHWLISGAGSDDSGLMPSGSRTSAVIKRSITLDGRRTSVSLENTFWTGLQEIAQFQCVTVSELVTSISHTRKRSNLSSAIRIFVLEYFQNESKRANLVPNLTPAADLR